MEKQRPGARTRRARLKVGDRVRFLWGFDPIVGVIEEYRGRFAVGRRHVYTVRAKMTCADDIVLELPEDLILSVRRAPSKPRSRKASPRARKVAAMTRRGARDRKRRASTTR